MPLGLIKLNEARRFGQPTGLPNGVIRSYNFGSFTAEPGVQLERSGTHMGSRPFRNNSGCPTIFSVTSRWSLGTL
jgi:hypothetical protein